MGLFRRKLGRASSGSDHLFGHVYGSDGDKEGRRDSGYREKNPERGILGPEQVNPLLTILRGLDLTEIFKTKGDLRRWSAKRTLGGLIASTACYQILETGATWPLVALCGIAVLPLCFSFFGE